MKVLTRGHRYELANFENKEAQGQILQFIEKAPVVNPEFPGQTVTINDGTTNEECLKMLIDRVQTLQNNFGCKENACCITHLEEALMWLEKRTRDRESRKVEGLQIA